MDTPSSTARVYDQAGFGRRVPRGARPAVIVVDFSYGFTDRAYPTGADMTGPVLATARLLGRARELGLPVVFTTIAYDPGQVGTLAWLRKATGMAALTLGSRLVEIDGRLAPRPEEHLVVKTGASAFFGTALAAYLTSAGADTVVVTGATTSGCVRATVVDAVQYGYPVLVPRDCVADRAPGPHEANLFDMDQKYGDVVDLDDVLSYLGTLPTTTAEAEAHA
ncbi:isochorismatase family protein [Amycolatopsis acidiphila]|uniref:Isochorismatase family protein n=1 Tax=Amycolatopsis acidiphila TaxID=715473 RepID=A0A558ANY5_9PSEU|nr:isochorismatase family protein [Amycolatopsis acidiphila]TVT25958.1 isochorismatase family protein [Amycolatopsis acidiphila]UIJ63330.1 isochorismatase family protein [Amycolatopsis acidiphila]GHG75065.1 N-carbamoylsarcosine amidase [Amycolatopsis acidiphila]